MKIGAVTLGFNDEKIIGGTIRNLKPFVDKHVVVISEKPYFGNETYIPDKTQEIAEDLGCQVVVGNFPLDHFQRNVGNVMCSDCDWIFTFDSDELMESSEIQRFIKQMEKTDAPAFVCDPAIYWKTTEYRLNLPPGYQPVIATRGNVRFSYIRNISSGFTVTDCLMHHVSWCAPKDIYKKVTTYAHATDFDGKKWYEEHYKNWKPGDKVVMTGGEICDAIYNPLPKELQDYLDATV